MLMATNEKSQVNLVNLQGRIHRSSETCHFLLPLGTVRGAARDFEPNEQKSNWALV